MGQGGAIRAEQRPIRPRILSSCSLSAQSLEAVSSGCRGGRDRRRPHGEATSRAGCPLWAGGRKFALLLVASKDVPSSERYASVLVASGWYRLARRRACVPRRAAIGKKLRRPMSIRKKSYRFGGFELNTHTRELLRDDRPVALAVVALDCLAYLIEHRDRPVSRDELISAVWGRTDVSESTLAHTIVRLRQVLGDSGSDQHSIRTVPRLGFRWVADVAIEETDVAAAVATAKEPISDAEPDCTQPRNPRQQPPRSRWLWPMAALLVAVSFIVVFATRSPPTPSPTPPAEPYTAWVMPAEIDASEDWAWLRLGLMDLVANRLRLGALATVPSETALALSTHWKQDPARAAADPRLGISLRVQPRVERIGNAWRVSLAAYPNEGRVLRAQAQADDVLVAARLATDDLLVALGHAPPIDGGRAPADPEKLLQQVAAARLAGRLPLALELLQRAPAQWRRQPGVALIAARVDCDRGDREACERRLNALLKQLPADKNPVLRARVLTSVAWLHANRAEYDLAERVLTEALALLRGHNAPDALGNIYSLRGWVRLTLSRLDEAVADLGQARLAFVRSGDIREIARTDQRLGVVAGRRGQSGTALALLQRAAGRFEAVGAQSDLANTLIATAEIQENLLEFEQALATTDRFWSPQFTRDWGRSICRAWVLAQNGRLREASTLAELILAEADPIEEVALRTEAQALLARIALQRGLADDAVRLAQQVAAPVLEEGDRREYLSNQMVLIRGLRSLGRLDAARREVERLRAWTDAAPDDWLRTGALLMEAEQDLAEGRLEPALRRYAEAMASAEHLGVPEWLVAVGYSYAPALIEADRLDQAGVIGGRIGAWADQDMRAAWVQARLHQALGDVEAGRAAEQRARRLAGERRLP
ncbi:MULTISPECIES: winged helix-turn-helix domain-containing protein [unclassified Lysobacter]|uniref:winged helix-turn-helix domain-containing protein n=1 Tax=unclassified Lysobacter TaxID=2635362 RepID=UPI001BE762E3|nr:MULTISPECIES: winged helix-turn-helix domain-containing protein [unclassified Lysobacter]MBT2748733.1 winged helix-turn-helix domain-containing protein [Lysobacter sp. ISL-42]MBT2751668.1 winged helix-turn-helix domain-containing protein [Lysobacter sp. ISL-50]MBT2775862.1 winged helix-turn-helix domain-containing protein [Lysobacter sp. ISL-54]MBT2782174.1 winged helix-turn-helix domain-containing protein [Lysobacter sp. ISL-52]